MNFVINTIENQKTENNITDSEANKKKIEKLIIFKYVLLRFKDNLDGFNGKKAFVLAWIYQLIGFFVTTLLFYTVVNYELFRIDKSNFITLNHPGIFDFFYYTVKTIALSGTPNIIPASIIARVVEITSYFTLGILLLIIVTSIFFSLRQDRLTENIKIATTLCLNQSQIIDEHVKNKYDANIQSFINESQNITTSFINIKKIIDNLF